MYKKELVIGVFSVGVLLILYFGFNFLKGFDLFSNTATYYATFRNVDNLAVSNSVRVNGVDVGRVSNIRIMHDFNNYVMVELDIDSEIQLNDSSKAILTSEFPSGRYIVISFGNGSNIIHYGDTIKGEVEKGMLDIFSDSATPVANDLQTILSKLSIAIEDLTKNSYQLSSIFDNLQSTPIKLNKAIQNTNENMHTITTEFVGIALNVNKTINLLGPVIKNFKSFSDSLEQLRLNSTVKETRNAIDRLSQTLQQFNKGDNTMGKLLTEDSLYNDLRTLIIEANSLLIHANKYPKHFTSPFGKSHEKVLQDMEKEKMSLDSIQNQ